MGPPFSPFEPIDFTAVTIGAETKLVGPVFTLPPNGSFLFKGTYLVRSLTDLDPNLSSDGGQQALFRAGATTNSADVLTLLGDQGNNPEFAYGEMFNPSAPSLDVVQVGPNQAQLQITGPSIGTIDLKWLIEMQLYILTVP